MLTNTGDALLYECEQGRLYVTGDLFNVKFHTGYITFEPEEEQTARIFCLTPLLSISEFALYWVRDKRTGAYRYDAFNYNRHSRISRRHKLRKEAGFVSHYTKRGRMGDEVKEIIDLVRPICHAALRANFTILKERSMSHLRQDKERIEMNRDPRTQQMYSYNIGRYNMIRGQMATLFDLQPKQPKRA